MRDNHAGLPELISAVERDQQFFGVAQVVIGEQFHAFEFGVDASAFKVLKAILQFRPFDKLPGVTYRYFFVPSVGRPEPNTDDVEFSIRVEQGPNGREFKWIAPRTLVTNLLWFYQLKSVEAANHLRPVASRPEV